MIPGAWRADDVLEDVVMSTARNLANAEGKRLRLYLKDYVNGIGSVSWQDSMA